MKQFKRQNEKQFKRQNEKQSKRKMGNNSIENNCRIQKKKCEIIQKTKPTKKETREDQCSNYDNHFFVGS